MEIPTVRAELEIVGLSPGRPEARPGGELVKGPAQKLGTSQPPVHPLRLAAAHRYRSDSREALDVGGTLISITAIAPRGAARCRMARWCLGCKIGFGYEPARCILLSLRILEKKFWLNQFNESLRDWHDFCVPRDWGVGFDAGFLPLFAAGTKIHVHENACACWRFSPGGSGSRAECAASAATHSPTRSHDGRGLHHSKRF